MQKKMGVAENDMLRQENCLEFWVGSYLPSMVMFHKRIHMPKLMKFHTLNICSLFIALYFNKAMF